ncbi:MAG: lipopolysaccharide heptosyltransferase II [Candidatus Hydrogenedentes bacterium]|nr:lipopolysaccharide heptosyltransferase II [Candidatus Hydrogenedentota bacterium]
MTENVRHILVLAPNWLGDAAMCTPALRALHDRFPESAITVAGRAAVCQLLEGLPSVAKVIPIPAKSGPRELARIGRTLAPHARDLCIVFPHSFRAALLARFTGSRQRLAYERGNRGILLTDTVAPHRENRRITPIFMAREYLELLAPLNCYNDFKGLELHAPPEDLAAVRAQLTPGRPTVGFAPGAAFGPSKRWPAERFAAVANELAQRTRAQFLLLTGPGEEDTRNAFLKALTVPVIEPQASRPTVARLKAAIACVDLLIGNDSGPRHIAIAFKKPVICIMGPTSPSYTENPQERGEVLRIDVDCGPCQKSHCVTGDHRCMMGVPVERAVTAALNCLKLSR